MTDRELLEDAAKAAGIYYWIDADAVVTHSDTPGSTREWNSLTNDGDAFRLGVKLGMRVTPRTAWADGFDGFTDSFGADDCAATRRAITRAAAEIGKGMK